MPRVSVLMPAHNADQHILRAVKSTLRALPADSEIVVGCDGCTDKTELVLRAVDDSRLRVLVDSSKRGVAPTLNRLLDQSDSEIVARMDADDICLPWRFSYQLSNWRPTELQFANVVHFGDGYRLPRPVFPLRLEPRLSRVSLLFENAFAHPTLLTSRAVMNSLGGYRNVPAQDYDLWMRAALRSISIRRRGLPAVMYRHHRRQITGSIDANRQKSQSTMLAETHRMLCHNVLGLELECWRALRSEGVHGSEAGRDMALLRSSALMISADWTELEKRYLKRAIFRAQRQDPTRISSCP